MYINIGDQSANAEQSANIPGSITTGNESANMGNNNTTKGGDGKLNDFICSFYAF